jgi:hypothetical protein
VSLPLQKEEQGSRHFCLQLIQDVRRQIDVDVIAERTLVLRAGDRSSSVIVRVARPHLDQSGQDWACPYEILFGGERKAMAMHGIDALQALQLTIGILDTELRFGAKKYGGSLLYLDQPFTSILECSGLKCVEPNEGPSKHS